jgi:hypothetical protein
VLGEWVSEEFIFTTPYERFILSSVEILEPKQRMLKKTQKKRR